MKLSLETVPFSYAGSYLAFSFPQDQGKGYEQDLTIRNIHGPFCDQDNFPVCLLDENDQKAVGEILASETELILKNDSRELRICFQNANTVCMKANTSFMVTKRRNDVYDRVMCHDYGVWEVTGEEYSLWFKIQEGSAENHSVWAEDGMRCERSCIYMRPGETGEFSCQMTLSGLSYDEPERILYEQALEDTKRKYSRFRRLYPAKGKYTEAIDEAVYILWSSIIEPEGYVKYPTILMSKNKMNMVWSWDYAINALAVADKAPDLAYEQFLSMEACQDRNGAFADCYSARTLIRNFVKPPVQGFVLRKMFRIRKPDRTVMERLYESVSKFTEWWFSYRGRMDGIPEYHHGNDSGWDNSTVFSMGLPVKSPDLCTWLIEQMDFLSELALELGKEEQGRKWKERSEELLTVMLKYFVKDNAFVAYKIPEMQVIHNSSLLMYIPLLLGDRLPESLREDMLDSLLKKGKFVSPYGLASEALDSPYFEEDGYWRGAVWPPTAWIFTEILMRNGRHEEAVKYAGCFCEMCRKYGFFENYSAIDGHGLRDSGYTWTASVFLILLRDYIKE